MRDPYHLLNVRCDAEPDVIKQAYHRLAKVLHPDRNPGDRQAEQQFKDVTQAYTLLSDPKARRDYDLGRIDASAPRHRRSHGSAAPERKADGWWGRGAEAIFDRVLRKLGLVRQQDARPHTSRESGRPGHGRAGKNDHDQASRDRAGTEETQTNGRAEDQHHRLEVDFLTAARGGRQRLLPADGPVLEIDIPGGIDNNAVLRLKGQGRSGRRAEARGDLLVHLEVREHRWFSRKGRNVHLDVPVSVKEALLGARIRIPTIDGLVSLAIPPQANSGQILRLKDKGVIDRSGQRGDQYVRLMVMLPKAPNADMTADLIRLTEQRGDDVRSHLDWD